MDLTFKTRKLQKQYETSREVERAYGPEVAKKYVQRIGTIKQARDIEELCNLPGLRCHELKGDRKGQWAMRLTGFYRLIFTLVGETLNVAKIEEVSKHYGD